MKGHIFMIRRDLPHIIAIGNDFAPRQNDEAEHLKKYCALLEENTLVFHQPAENRSWAVVAV